MIEAQDELKIQAGLFFRTTAEVWEETVQQVDTDNNDYMAEFWRQDNEGVKNIVVRWGQRLDQCAEPYKISLENINRDHEVASLQSLGSEKTPLKMKKWPLTIFGEEAVSDEDEIAHLIPRMDSEEWIGIAAAALALEWKETPDDPEQYLKDLLMATRGVEKKQSPREDGSYPKGQQKQKKGKGAESTRSPSKKRHKNEEGKTQKGGKRSNDTKVGTAQSINSTSRDSSSVSFQDNSHAATSKTSQSGYRKTRTGIVHSELNKIRVHNHASSLDSDSPKLLVIPCLTLKEAREWKGQGYKAVVLAGVPDGIFSSKEKFDKKCVENGNYKVYGQLVDKAEGLRRRGVNREQKSIAARIGFDTFRDVNAMVYEKSSSLKQQYEDVEKARVSLKDTLLALVQFNKKMKVMLESMLEQDITIPLKQKTQNAFTNRDDVDELLVPKNCKELTDTLQRENGNETTKPGNETPKPFLIIEFSDNDMTQPTKHRAPDPLLLLAKAANIWGRMTGLKILANGEVDQDSFDSFDDWVDPVGSGHSMDCDAGIPKEIMFSSEDNPTLKSIAAPENATMLQPVFPITPNSTKVGVLDEMIV